MYFILCILVIFSSSFILPSNGKSLSSFVYVNIYCVDAGLNTLMSISNVLDPYIFLSKDGKDAVNERRNGRKGVYFPPGSAFCPL